jgi:hypothetical protein
MNRSLKIESNGQGARQRTVVRSSERSVARNDRPELPYEPSPLDTSAVALDEQILVLTELLAKHTHDVWAQQRLGRRMALRPDPQRCAQGTSESRTV